MPGFFQRTRFLLVAVTAALLSAPIGAAGADPGKADRLAIVPGTVVSLEYTLSDDQGKQIESNKGKEPLVYTQGQHQIVPGLEKALTGLHAGDEKTVKVLPEEGYGPVEKDALQEIPKDQIPAEARKAGTFLQARSAEGQTRMVRVSEVKDKTVVIDFNHPLAGKTLAFHVKVIDVKLADGKVEGLPDAKPGK